MCQLIMSRKIERSFLLSLATLLVASVAFADVGEDDTLQKSSKTLRKRVIVKKADDDLPVPNSAMSDIDPRTVEAIQERWRLLQNSINRSHRFDPLATTATPGDIRPWGPPTDTREMRGSDPLTIQVNGTPSSVSGGASSVVNEPSVAAVDDYVFYTANWYAAASTDGGTSWNFVNPNTGPFPTPAGQTFCCDQQVHHDIETNTLFWLQQMIPQGGTDEGTQRINVDQDTDGTWDCFYDVTPQDADFADNTFPDYPDFSVSDGNLFVTSNVFGSGGGGFQGAFVGRLPLAEITACQNAMVDFYTDTNFGSFRTTQGAGDTMYFADLETQTSIRVWSWPDAAMTPANVTRTVNAFLFGTRNCADPNGTNWCGFLDSRLMGGAIAGNRVAFLWVAEENPGGGFPFPYTQGVILDASNNLSVLEQPLIWSNDAAWIYPSLAANANGAFGGTVLWGGGTFFPRCSAFIVDDQNSNTWTPLEHEIVIAGNGGAGTGRSGDYLSTRVFSSNQNVFAASCFAYPTTGTGESRFALFGRESGFANVEIFLDGFESGNVTAWSTSFP